MVGNWFQTNINIKPQQTIGFQTQKFRVTISTTMSPLWDDATISRTMTSRMGRLSQVTNKKLKHLPSINYQEEAKAREPFNEGSDNWQAV